MSNSSFKVVSVIPARGGSKSIPRKNLIDLCGKPLIQYSIDASLCSDVDQTWVSSDDAEILSVAKRLGARTIKRPDEFATDEASSESALLHFAQNVDFDYLVFIQATSPLINYKDINKGLELLQTYDSIVSVIENNHFSWTNGMPDYDLRNRPRRQDRGTQYLETGAFYITSRASLLTSRVRASGEIGFVKTSRLSSLEIDEKQDLDEVRLLVSSGIRA